MSLSGQPLQSQIQRQQEKATHQIARTVALTLLPPSLIDLIEQSIPEAQPGDIEAGRIVLMHTRPFATHVELGVLMPGATELQRIDLEFIDNQDITLLAKVIEMLDEWDRKVFHSMVVKRAIENSLQFLGYCFLTF